MKNYVNPAEGHLYVREDGRGYAFRWTCQDSDLWREILHDLKRTFSHATGRRYDPDTREWYVPYYGRDRFIRWASAWFREDAVTWDDDEEPAGRTYGHHDDEPDSRRLAQAYQALHLLPSAPPQVARAAHRAMVRLTHPDAGGSHEAAVAVNRAWEVISARCQECAP